MFSKKNDTQEKKIQQLEEKVVIVEDSLMKLLKSIEIISRRLDTHVEFISSISKTNNLILKILDFENSPPGQNDDDAKFLGFDFEEEEE